MGARLGTAGAASIGFHINAAKMGADSVRYGPTNWWKYVVLVAVVGVKWLEQQPRNLEAPSSNPPGARAFFLFFFYLRQSVLNLVPCISAVFPLKILTLAVLLEAKQD